MPTVTTFELVRYLKAQRRTLPPLQHVLFLHGERHFPLTFCDHALPDNGQISRDICPFKGLEAFTQNDANFFYGRKRITQQFLDRLEKAESKRLIPIVGASGSGKSSLVLAGILPNLLADDWEVQVIQPAGGCPLHNLQVQIPTDKKYLLVIDQFEQVFTQCHDEADKTAFKHLLAMTLQPDNRLYVLLTLRWDFLERFTKFAQDAHPEMGEYLRRIELLPSLNADELHQVITEPLAKVGMSIENSLVNELLAESLDEKGSLPLLQYTLEKLWLEAKQTGNDRLTWDLYRQLGGQQGEGLRGILNQKADAFYHSLNAEQQHLLEWLMVRLTQHREDDSTYTRRTLTERELYDDQPEHKDTTHVLIERLASEEYRLLTKGSTPNGEATVTVAHEALIRDWTLLENWLGKNQEITHWRERIAKDIADWNKIDGSLLRDGRLVEAQEVLNRYPKSLLIGKPERAFIQASIELQQREQLKVEREKRIRRIGVIAFIVVLLLGFVVTFWQRNEAVQQREIAVQQKQEAERQKSMADKQEQEANRQARAVLVGKLASQSQVATGLHSSAQGWVNQGLLLAVQAFRLSPTSPKAQGVLLDSVHGGHLRRSLYTLDFVDTFAFSPDGRFVVSSSGNVLCLWDVISGQIIGKPWFGDQVRIISVAFSPDGKFVVSSSGNTLRLWDVLSGQPIGDVLHGHERSVSSVAFSPDGKYVISGSYDDTLRLWDAVNRRSIGRPWTGHEDIVASVAFSPNGKYVVSGSYDGTLRLWDAIIGQSIGEPWSEGHKDAVTSVAFSPDGKYVVSGSKDGTLRLWDVLSGQLIGGVWRGHERRVNSVAFSPDGNYVVSGGDDSTLRLWDATSGQPLGEPWRGHEDWVTSVAFSPDGKYVFSGGMDKTLRQWEMSNKQLVVSEPLTGHEDSVTSVDFSPNGKYVISCSGDETLRLWSVINGQPLGEPWRGHKSSVNSAVFSPDGSYIVSGSSDKTLRMWSVPSGQPIGQPWRGHEAPIDDVAFSPNGKYVVSGSYTSTHNVDFGVNLWDISSGKPIRKLLDGYATGLHPVAFSPDNKYVVNGSGNNNALNLWDVETGQSIGESWQGNKGAVFAVAFSPDGKYVVSGGYDAALRLWDVTNGQQIGEPWYGHEESVYSLAFSPGSKYVVSGGMDKTLRLWDVATGQSIGEPLHGHEAQVVNSVAFSPDGKFVVSGGGDKTLRLWDADPESWAKKACSIVNRNFSLAEWQRFIGDALPYEKTCPDLPAPGEDGWLEPYVGG